MLINEELILNAIMWEITDVFEITEDDFRGKSRLHELAVARHLFCFIARQYDLTLKVIGKYLSNRDHTTVLHSVETFENMIDIYPVELEFYRLIKSKVDSRIHQVRLEYAQKSQKFNLELLKEDIMKIYIAGKISKEDIKKTAEKFNTAEYILKKQGYKEILNPLKIYNVDDGRSDEEKWIEAMETLIPYLVASNAVYMLADWQLSKGARIEHAVAKAEHKKIIYQEFAV